jgi:hypothetical protein
MIGNLRAVLMDNFPNMMVFYPPNDGASAAAHLRPTPILAENVKPHFWIRTRRLGGQLQARVGHLFLLIY